MKIQFHRIDTNVVVGLLVREFCCSGTDVSAKVLAMYAGTRTPSMEPQWLAAGLSQHPNQSKGIVRFQYAVFYTATTFHCCVILPQFFRSCKRFFLFFFDFGYFPCFAHFLLQSLQFFYKRIEVIVTKSVQNMENIQNRRKIEKNAYMNEKTVVK